MRTIRDPGSFRLFAAACMLVLASERVVMAADVTESALTLQGVQSADPAADVKQALADHDYRFIGVRGYALEVPGAEDVYEPFGVKIIEGTSDVMDESQRAAREYASRYNQLLIMELKVQGKIQQ